MKRFFYVSNIIVILFFCLLSANSTKAQKIFDEKEASFKGIKFVQVEGSFCDVRVEGRNESTVAFHGIIKGWLHRGRDFKIHHEQMGDMLKIWIERPNSYSGRIDGKLEFQVPTHIRVDVRNSSGDIHLSGIECEKMNLKTTSGDVVLKDVMADLELESTSGNIEISRYVGNIEARSTSGDQEFQGVKGEIFTRASSGDLVFSDIRGNITSRTSSGDVDFHWVTGDVMNESTSGNMELSDCEGAFNLQATSGNIQGKGIKLNQNSKFKTSSGDISLDFSNDINDLSFDLRASSGDLSIGNRRGDKEMVVRNGDIIVRGVSTSGNQRYN